MTTYVRVVETDTAGILLGARVERPVRLIASESMDGADFIFGWLAGRFWAQRPEIFILLSGTVSDRGRAPHASGVEPGTQTQPGTRMRPARTQYEQVASGLRIGPAMGPASDGRLVGG